MSASHRVSRDFHRLALLIAGIPLMLGALAVLIEITDINQQSAKHQKILCAHDYVQQHGVPSGTLFDQAAGFLNLKPIGCSDIDDRAKLDDVRNPPDFSWAATFFDKAVSFWVPLSLLLAAGVYGLVRFVTS